MKNRPSSHFLLLLLLVALVLVYLYNFRVLDLDRIPYMSGVSKNAYAFLNLGMAGFVMATVTVRFVFPAVSAEGAAFWIIRTAPISLLPSVPLTRGSALMVVGQTPTQYDRYARLMVRAPSAGLLSAVADLIAPEG